MPADGPRASELETATLAASFGARSVSGRRTGKESFVIEDITESQALAARKHCASALRKLNISSPLDFEPHRLTWGELSETSATAIRAANDALTRGENRTGPEAEDLDRAYAAMVTIHEACEGEKDTRTKSGNRGPRQHGGDPRRPGGDSSPAAAAAPRRSRNGWRDLRSGREVPVLDPNQSIAETMIEARADDLDGLGIAGFVRAAVIGPSSEAERRALGTMVGTAGGYAVPAPLAADIIDVMRRQSVMMRAGARTVVMPSSTLDRPGWRPIPRCHGVAKTSKSPKATRHSARSRFTPNRAPASSGSRGG